VGQYSNKPLDTSNLQDLSSLSPQAIQDGKEKSLRAEWSQWTVNGGEAGNFVERIAGGGIIGFHLGRDDGKCLFYSLRFIDLDICARN